MRAFQRALARCCRRAVSDWLISCGVHSRISGSSSRASFRALAPQRELSLHHFDAADTVIIDLRQELAQLTPRIDGSFHFRCVCNVEIGRSKRRGPSTRPLDYRFALRDVACLACSSANLPAC